MMIIGLIIILINISIISLLLTLRSIVEQFIEGFILFGGITLSTGIATYLIMKMYNIVIVF